MPQKGPHNYPKKRHFRTMPDNIEQIMADCDACDFNWYKIADLYCMGNTKNPISSIRKRLVQADKLQWFYEQRDIRPGRETQAKKVLKNYDTQTAKTDPEISELTGLPLHVICARRNELVKNGLVKEWSSKRNEATGKLNTAYLMTFKGYAVAFGDEGRING